MVSIVRDLKSKSKTEKIMYYVGLPLAMVVLAIFYSIPTPEGISFEGKMSLGIFLFALILWVTESLPNYAVSMISIALLSILGGWAEKNALGTMGYGVIWLMISAFIITSGMEKSGLAKRIALAIITRFGKTWKSMLLSLMAANFTIAFIVPSTTARAAMLLPIVLLIAKAFNVESGNKNLGKLLSIQGLQANNISTSAIVTATAPQILAIGLMKELTGSSVSWGEWFIASAPIAVLTLIASFFIGIFLFKPNGAAKAGGEEIKEINRQYLELGPVSLDEKKAASIFFVTIFLWATDKWHMDLFGFQISLVMVAVISASIFFMPYVGILTWKEAKIPWNLMVFAAGAYAVGVSLSETGVASWALGSIFSHFGVKDMSFTMLYAVVIAISSFSHFVFTSKTVRTIILIPTLIGLAESAGVPPLMLALPAAFTIADTITLPPHSKANLIYYSTGYFSVNNQLTYGVLTLLAKWCLMFGASFTWFAYLGITP
ncbi:anion permease [Grimontia kaedaensis]|uniref:Anion permease n=2 Tax=Grimontia kaedaensis TaxID=2872157 RepID=A0ABY4WQ68_9GAMM|nr:anion permease [Grimontia kaedaensis]